MAYSTSRVSSINSYMVFHASELIAQAQNRLTTRSRVSRYNGGRRSITPPRYCTLGYLRRPGESQARVRGYTRRTRCFILRGRKFLREQAEDSVCRAAAETVGNPYSRYDVDRYGFLVCKAPLDGTLQRVVPKRLRAKKMYIVWYNAKCPPVYILYSNTRVCMTKTALVNFQSER